MMSLSISLGGWSVTDNPFGESRIHVCGMHSQKGSSSESYIHKIPVSFLADVWIYDGHVPPEPFEMPSIHSGGEAVEIGRFRELSNDMMYSVSVSKAIHLKIQIPHSHWREIRRQIISGDMLPQVLIVRLEVGDRASSSSGPERAIGRVIGVEFLHGSMPDIFSCQDVSKFIYAYLKYYFAPDESSAGETRDFRVAAFANHQFRSILWQLTESALESFVRDGSSLGEGMETAFRTALSVWGELERINNSNTDYRESTGAAPHERISGWKKRSPGIDHSLGMRSPSRIEVTVGDFSGIAHTYLDSGLRSSLVEYIVADGMMYAEILAFSKQVIRGIPGAGRNAMARGFEGVDWDSYSALSRALRSKRIRRIIFYSLMAILFSVFMATYQYDDFGWASLAFASLAAMSAAGLRRLFWKLDVFGLRSREKAFSESKKLLSLMGDAYHQISPTASSEDMIRVLDRSVDAGAVWHPMVYQMLREKNAGKRPSSVFGKRYSEEFIQAVEKIETDIAKR